MQPGDVVHPDPVGNDQDNTNNDLAQDQTLGGQMDDQTTPAPMGDEPTTNDAPATDVPATDTPAEPVVPAEEPSAPADAPAGDVPAVDAPAEEPVAPAETPAADPAPESDAPAEAPPADAPDANANETAAPAAVSNSPVLSWEASEFMTHHHPLSWYIVLGLVTVGLVVLAVLVLKEWLSAAVVVLMAIALVVYAHRQPRTLTYAVTAAGLQVGDKFHSYNEFKAFAVVATGEFINLELDPVKRFMPRLSIFVDQAHAEAVAAELGRHLPRDERAADFMDKLAHALKF